MKVERKKIFKPITITLETEEEALAMWVKLHISSEYCVEQAERIGVKADKEKCFNIFKEFDDIFDPTK